MPGLYLIINNDSTSTVHLGNVYVAHFLRQFNFVNAVYVIKTNYVVIQIITVPLTNHKPQKRIMFGIMYVTI